MHRSAAARRLAFVRSDGALPFGAGPRIGGVVSDGPGPAMPEPAPSSTAPLLAAADPPPFEIVHPARRAPLLLICDHASRAVPRALGGLGLDGGAADAAYRLGHRRRRGDAASRRAARCAGGAVRLFAAGHRLQPRRSAIRPRSRRSSDGIAVPGNAGLDRRRRASRRVDGIFRPYHAAIAAQLRLRRRRPCPVVLSMHSFTPRHERLRAALACRRAVGQGSARRRSRCCRLAAGRSRRVVGDNEPYSARDAGRLFDAHTTPSPARPAACRRSRCARI